MRPFAYERPDRIDDVVAILAGSASARLLAGGTDLIIRLRDGTARPDVVVDVKRVADLDDGIHESHGRLVIGGRAVMTDIAAHPVVRRSFTGLAESAAVVGSVQIRNRATLAGNIGNASPAADTVPSLLVHGATVVVRGPNGERRVPIDDAFVRSGVTTIAGDEVIAAIELALPAGPSGSVHQRRTRRRGHDLASVTLACTIDAHGVTRIAFGSVGPRPLLRVDPSGLLADGGRPEADRRAALDELLADAAPSATSMRATPDYRLAMLRVLGWRAVQTALARRAGATA
ncbi:MAG TPA: FAD binding domain-containing protein [Candidatus Limnocylindrales bacterium]|nr:FAD binding domain-containing protein [Candidatus Limnocylindrales bacterium]